MICKIVHFSEAEFPTSSVIQIDDDIGEGDEIFISRDHTLTVEHFIKGENTLTIIDGEKILKLQKAY